MKQDPVSKLPFQNRTRHLLVHFNLGLTVAAFFSCCLNVGALEAGKSGDAPTDATSSQMSCVKAALAEPEETKRLSMLREVAAEMGRTQPSEGRKIIEQLPTVSDKKLFGVVLTREWAKTQPQEALAAALKLPAGLVRRSACAAAIEGWAVKDPSAALEWAVDKLAGSNRREGVARGAAVWAKTDPIKAAEWAVAHNTAEPGSPSIAIEEVMRTWAVRDPQKAGEWCLKLPEGDFRDLALSALVFRMADDKPEAAARWLDTHKGHEWLVPRVAAIWAATAPAEAANWVMQSENEQALSPIMLSWADDAPEEALQWCKANLAGDLYAEMRHEILGTWAADDGITALEWVFNLSSPEEGTSAAIPAMEAWLGDSKTPLPQISAWVSSQKPGIVRSVCLQKLAIALEPGFPLQAMTAALNIQDRKLLQETLKTVWTAWRKRDSIPARAWLNQHPEAQSMIYK
jgi:hypothetical protein